MRHQARLYAAPGQFTPDLAILQVGVVALDLARVDRSEPIAKSELLEQHLTELDLPNQRVRGGLEFDVLNDMYGWRTTDIVEYAVIAATATSGPAHTGGGSPSSSSW